MKPKMLVYREVSGEAFDRGVEVYFPMEDFGEEMTVEQYREEFPKNEMAPVEPHANDDHP